MSLNNSHMLPERVRNMKQMNDVLNAEDIILAEIERTIAEMYQRESLLHEEMVNEAWLESKLSERTGAGVDVTGYAEWLLAKAVLDVSELKNIDMLDIRRFLDKWVPAHLMYKIILLLEYSFNIKEVFSVKEMTIGFDFPFWNVRRLDGAWLLNGNFLLDATRIKIKPKIELGSVSALHEETIEAGVEIKHDYWVLDGSVLLNGERLLDATIEREVL